jgi:hypothetical protein
LARAKEVLRYNKNEEFDSQNMQRPRLGKA